jgi:hypothetical protein
MAPDAIRDEAPHRMASWIGKVVRFAVERGRSRTPHGHTLCLHPGAA